MMKPVFVPGWEVEGIPSGSPFFGAVIHLLPPTAYFCFEGTSIAAAVWALYEAHATSPKLEIPTGTLWPKPRMIHVPSTPMFLRKMVLLADRHAEPELCDHLHAYVESRLLLQWYDAFDLSLLVDQSISEDAVRMFCEVAGARYKSYQPPRGK